MSLLMLFKGGGGWGVGLILQFYKDKMKEFNLKVGPCSVLTNINTEVDLNCEACEGSAARVFGFPSLIILKSQNCQRRERNRSPDGLVK